MIITRNLGAPLPLRRVLVPTTGAPFARLGATVAILYADATSARLTSLYVKEGPQISLRNLYPSNPIVPAALPPMRPLPSSTKSAILPANSASMLTYSSRSLVTSLSNRVAHYFCDR